MNVTNLLDLEISRTGLGFKFRTLSCSYFLNISKDRVYKVNIIYQMEIINHKEIGNIYDSG